ncbi:C39 family peptidase [Actinomycetospora sp. CA-101289]|uniref:C39 family peptidase n=1 Tax=Actinomycetospora sp. CA-101289 TaxID=3239893 RepID=UPI003D99A9A8
MSDDEGYGDDAFAADDQDSGGASSWSTTATEDQDIDSGGRGEEEESYSADEVTADDSTTSADAPEDGTEDAETTGWSSTSVGTVLGDPSLDATDYAEPQDAVPYDDGILAGGVATVDASLVPAGMDPALYVDPSTVLVDPTASTVIGSPAIDQGYFQPQGPANANCGPYSAAMAINAMTGSNISGEELAEFAKQQGWMEQDFVNGNPDWGYWSGLEPKELEALIDAYVGPGGGDATRSYGSLDTLAGHLAADHPVVVMVDSGELASYGSGFDADAADQKPNHFVTVTGIDPVRGQIFLNDPAKSAPIVMPLAQFEAAWRDSGNQMLEVNPGVSGSLTTEMTSAPTAAPPAEGPLVPLPATAPTAATTLSPTFPADASLSAVPVPLAPAPPLATGCCVLPMTFEWQVVDPVATVGAPPVPPAVAAVGMPPNTIPTTSGLSSSIVPPMGRTGA